MSLKTLPSFPAVLSFFIFVLAAFVSFDEACLRNIPWSLFLPAEDLRGFNSGLDGFSGILVGVSVPTIMLLACRFGTQEEKYHQTWWALWLTFAGILIFQMVALIQFFNVYWSLPLAIETIAPLAVFLIYFGIGKYKGYRTTKKKWDATTHLIGRYSEY